MGSARTRRHRKENRAAEAVEKAADTVTVPFAGQGVKKRRRKKKKNSPPTTNFQKNTTDRGTQTLDSPTPLLSDKDAVEPIEQYDDFLDKVMVQAPTANPPNAVNAGREFPFASFKLQGGNSSVAPVSSRQIKSTKIIQTGNIQAIGLCSLGDKLESPTSMSSNQSPAQTGSSPWGQRLVPSVPPEPQGEDNKPTATNSVNQPVSTRRYGAESNEYQLVRQLWTYEDAAMALFANHVQFTQMDVDVDKSFYDLVNPALRTLIEMSTSKNSEGSPADMAVNALVTHAKTIQHALKRWYKAKADYSKAFHRAINEVIQPLEELSAYSMFLTMANRMPRTLITDLNDPYPVEVPGWSRRHAIFHPNRPASYNGDNEFRSSVEYDQLITAHLHEHHGLINRREDLSNPNIGRDESANSSMDRNTLQAFIDDPSSANPFLAAVVGETTQANKAQGKESNVPQGIVQANRYNKSHLDYSSNNIIDGQGKFNLGYKDVPELNQSKDNHTNAWFNDQLRDKAMTTTTNAQKAHGGSAKRKQPNVSEEDWNSDFDLDKQNTRNVQSVFSNLHKVGAWPASSLQNQPQVKNTQDTKTSSKLNKKNKNVQ